MFGWQYTDGDTIPEITGDPVLPTSLAATDTSLSVTFKVDTDAKGVMAFVAEYDGAAMLNYAPGTTVTNGEVTVNVTGLTFVKGKRYYVYMDACFNATCSPSNDMRYGKSLLTPGTYKKYPMYTGGPAPVELGVSIPILTAQ